MALVICRIYYKTAKKDGCLSYCGETSARMYRKMLNYVFSLLRPILIAIFIILSFAAKAHIIF